MCVLKLNPDDNLSNDDPSRAGQILAIGEMRPECFAGSNWPRAIPVVWDKDVEPQVPAGTLWLRIDAAPNGQLVVGVAAPAIERLGICVGDRATVSLPLSVCGEGSGTLAACGRDAVAFSSSSMTLRFKAWPLATRSAHAAGACPGEEHSLSELPGSRLRPAAVTRRGLDLTTRSDHSRALLTGDPRGLHWAGRMSGSEARFASGDRPIE